MKKHLTAEQKAAMKAGRAAGLAKFDGQVLIIDGRWKIQRADQWNWEMTEKVKESWVFRGFYGKLPAALMALPAHMLNADTKDSLQQVIGLLKDLSYSIRAALPDAKRPTGDNP